MMAKPAARKCLTLPGVETVLDVGCGLGQHTEFFKENGKRVTAVDIVDRGFNITANYMKEYFGPHDLVWCSHILEHQPNVNEFLTKCRRECAKYICISVPPKKDEIVGGHVSIWNAGLVMYNLVLAGFDCSNAKINKHGYNISVIAEVGNFELPDLHYDYGDIEKISPWLPKGYNTHGFNGDIESLNWR